MRVAGLRMGVVPGRQSLECSWLQEQYVVPLHSSSHRAFYPECLFMLLSILISLLCLSSLVSEAPPPGGLLFLETPKAGLGVSFSHSPRRLCLPFKAFYFSPFIYYFSFLSLTVLSLCCCARASHCGGSSGCGAQAVGTGGLQCLQHAGSVVVAHGLSCSAACGIFPDQGSNLFPLQWQVNSHPQYHQGSLLCLPLLGKPSIRTNYTNS